MTLVAFAAAAGLTLPVAGATASQAQTLQAGGNTPASAYQISGQAKSVVDPEAVQKAAKIIRGAVEDGINSGYGSIVVSGDGVHLFWKGQTPLSLNPYLASARDHAPVEVLPADYSDAELRSQAEVIAQDIKNDLEGPVIGVRFAPDASGLILLIRENANPGNLGIPSVNVEYTTEKSAVPELTSRQADTPPFSGGHVLNNTAPGAQYTCTSGFPVTKNGQTYLLTAGHCGNVGNQFRNGTTTVGSATQEHQSHDLLLIQAPSAGNIYDGPPTTNNKRAVAGWDYVYVGEYVKSSGSGSGTVPNLQVTGYVYTLTVQDTFGVLTTITDQIETVQVNGLPPATGGDSGAPIFADYGVKAAAKGSASAVSGTRLFFAPFTNAIVDFGISPLVN
ncbi:hypothetical protein C1I98_10170 [Spongiactinospora gelatinilytica]|uniref:Peptidase S1 domain-containing protein n=1 Tax=Spongiactinospora gelatinilytica TaxID=2666298 RepID=A0A2W2HJM2_9ACTN|nr:hypothetical protein [Spongiactinospora gelatinilytica]PZG50590.1 hypothetical protein C1I98_10170 [Spongiactinospora gelatinilytica]